MQTGDCMDNLCENCLHWKRSVFVPTMGDCDAGGREYTRRRAGETCEHFAARDARIAGLEAIRSNIAARYRAWLDADDRYDHNLATYDEWDAARRALRDALDALAARPGEGEDVGT